MAIPSQIAAVFVPGASPGQIQWALQFQRRASQGDLSICAHLLSMRSEIPAPEVLAFAAQTLHLHACESPEIMQVCLKLLLDPSLIGRLPEVVKKRLQGSISRSLLAFSLSIQDVLEKVSKENALVILKLLPEELLLFAADSRFSEISSAVSSGIAPYMLHCVAQVLFCDASSEADVVLCLDCLLSWITVIPRELFLLVGPTEVFPPDQQLQLQKALLCHGKRSAVLLSKTLFCFSEAWDLISPTEDETPEFATSLLLVVAFLGEMDHGLLSRGDIALSTSLLLVAVCRHFSLLEKHCFTAPGCRQGMWSLTLQCFVHPLPRVSQTAIEAVMLWLEGPSLSDGDRFVQALVTQIAKANESLDDFHWKQELLDLSISIDLGWVGLDFALCSCARMLQAVDTPQHILLAALQLASSLIETMEDRSNHSAETMRTIQELVGRLSRCEHLVSTPRRILDCLLLVKASSKVLPTWSDPQEVIVLVDRGVRHPVCLLTASQVAKILVQRCSPVLAHPLASLYLQWYQGLVETGAHYKQSLAVGTLLRALICACNKSTDRSSMEILARVVGSLCLAVSTDVRDPVSQEAISRIICSLEMLRLLSSEMVDPPSWSSLVLAAIGWCESWHGCQQVSVKMLDLLDSLFCVVMGSAELSLSAPEFGRAVGCAVRQLTVPGASAVRLLCSQFQLWGTKSFVAVPKSEMRPVLAAVLGVCKTQISGSDVDFDWWKEILRFWRFCSFWHSEELVDFESPLCVGILELLPPLLSQAEICVDSVAYRACCVCTERYSKLLAGSPALLDRFKTVFPQLAVTLVTSAILLVPQRLWRHACAILLQFYQIEPRIAAALGAALSRAPFGIDAAVVAHLVPIAMEKGPQGVKELLLELYKLKSNE